MFTRVPDLFLRPILCRICRPLYYVKLCLNFGQYFYKLKAFTQKQQKVAKLFRFIAETLFKSETRVHRSAEREVKTFQQILSYCRNAIKSYQKAIVRMRCADDWATRWPFGASLTIVSLVLLRLPEILQLFSCVLSIDVCVNSKYFSYFYFYLRIMQTICDIFKKSKKL